MQGSLLNSLKNSRVGTAIQTSLFTTRLSPFQGHRTRTRTPQFTSPTQTLTGKRNFSLLKNSLLKNFKLPFTSSPSPPPSTTPKPSEQLPQPPPKTDFDQGTVRKLAKEWVEAFSPKTVPGDVAAAMTVLTASIPLSLGIAATIGVSPTVGLVSAMVGGVVGGLFGANRFVVTGPANAMAAALGSIFYLHGQYGLTIVAGVCGLAQLFGGLVGAGQLIRYIPSSVISGFTAGIGAIIFCAQLPKVLSFTPPSSTALDILWYTGGHVAEFFGAGHSVTTYLTLALGLGTFAATLLLPRLHPKAPAHLGALVLATVANFYLGLPTVGPFMGDAGMGLLPQLPSPFPGLADVLRMGIPCMLVTMMASAETLLTLAAMERQTHLVSNPNQELAAQGFANLACALFNSMPVCAVLARSTLNMAAGSQTRFSLVLQSLLIGVAMVCAEPLIAAIPNVALAGIMLNLAYNLAKPSWLLFRATKIKILPWCITFGAILAADLMTGVLLGTLTSYTLGFMRYGTTPFRISPVDVIRVPHEPGTEAPYPVRIVHLFRCDGPAHAGSIVGVNRFRKFLKKGVKEGSLKEGDHIVLDFKGVEHVDLSGAEQMVFVAYYISSHGIGLTIINANSELQQQSKLFEWNGLISKALSPSSAVPPNLLITLTNGQK